MEYATELPEDLQEQIEALSDQGREATEQGRYEEAVELYNQALAALPEPRENWEAYIWLKAAMGDACFHMDRLDDGLDHFYESYMAAGQESANPFIIYRLGQIYRQIGDEEHAVDFLSRAYLLEGEDIFEDEEDLVYLRNRADLHNDDDENDGGYEYGRGEEDYDDSRYGAGRFDDEGFSRGYIPRDDYEEYGDD